VEDVAQEIVEATEKYNKLKPINIGAGFEISMRNLVELIVELTCYQGKIIWNPIKPDVYWTPHGPSTNSAFRPTRISEKD
jgi:GDP-L-fucose synthase